MEATLVAEAAKSSPQIQRVPLEEILARPEVIVEGKYKVLEKICEGAFGAVWKGICLRDGKEIALKFERNGSTMATELVLEGIIYAMMNAKKDHKVAKMKWFGLFEGHKVLVMDLLGPSLASLFRTFPYRFSVRNVMLLGVEMINGLEELHKMGFIHRDIKPDNFCMGLGSKSETVHLIDFGLAMRFADGCRNTFGDIPVNEFCGNKRFCSVNALLRRDQSRRDDLEALAYVLVYFIKGSLPWDDAKNLYKTKTNASLKAICKDTPEELSTYLKYAKGLGFKDEPDYDWIRRLFGKALVRCNPGLRLDVLVRLDLQQPDPVSN